MTMFNLKRFITWSLRLMVGATFVFSGFVKAIDPWGTFYKFEDYVGALGLPDYSNLVLAAVFLLCVFEFTLGVFLIMGCFRRSTPIATALLMCVMLPLTLWIAVKDPVDDCGCFGDALVISNWATFWKNVVLCLAIAWLVKYNTSCRCLIRPYVQWIASLFTMSFAFAISWCGYVYQPLIDFRPFPIGASLISKEAGQTLDNDASHDSSDGISDTNGESTESDDGNEDEPEMLFVYAKDGKEQTFTLDDELPDENDGWVFVRREYPDVADNRHDNIKKDDTEFPIWSENGDEEVSGEVLRAKGGELLLLMPDLANVSIATTWQINSLYNWAKELHLDMIAVVAGSNDDIERWRDLSLAAYPIYKAEDTNIKMLARGNPAIVYLRDGNVIWKSTLRSLDTEDFESDSAPLAPEDLARDNNALLKNAILVYLALMSVLVFFSFLPSLVRFFPSKMGESIKRRDANITKSESKFNRDGKADR